MNQRQQNFLQEVISLANKMNDIYEESFNLSQSFAEEFATGQPNSMNPMDNLVNEPELQQYGITYTVLKNMLEKSAAEFVKFYTNLAVTQAEYGKFIRRIKTI